MKMASKAIAERIKLLINLSFVDVVYSSLVSNVEMLLSKLDLLT